MRIWLWLAALCLASPTVVAAAPSEEPAPCTWETAEVVKFSDVATHTRRYDGQCVRIKGIWGGGRVFFANLDAAYRAGPLKPGKDTLGVYVPEDVVEPDGLKVVEMLARPGLCSDLWDQEPQDVGPNQIWVPFVSGYCHYFGTAYVDVDAVTFRPDVLARPVGEAARRRLHQLKFAPIGSAAEREATAFARHWRTLVVSGDVAGLARLEGSVEEQFGPDDERASEVFHGPASLQSRLSSLPAEPQTVVLVTSRTIGDPPRPIRYVCSCVGPNCSGRWPVAEADTHYDPVHPYICVGVVPGDGDEPFTSSTTIDRRRIAEPD